MFENCSILYVEDDILSQEIMRMFLVRALGVRSLTLFGDSTDFLERVKAITPQPDVILLDIHISPVDGPAMLTLLRRDPEFDQARIIAVTASATPEEVEAIRRHGFDGLINKPLSLEAFPTQLEMILRREAVWPDK